MGAVSHPVHSASITAENRRFAPLTVSFPPNMARDSGCKVSQHCTRTDTYSIILLCPCRPCFYTLGEKIETTTRCKCTQGRAGQWMYHLLLLQTCYLETRERCTDARVRGDLKQYAGKTTKRCECIRYACSSGRGKARTICCYRHASSKLDNVVVIVDSAGISRNAQGLSVEGKLSANESCSVY